MIRGMVGGSKGNLEFNELVFKVMLCKARKELMNVADEAFGKIVVGDEENENLAESFQSPPPILRKKISPGAVSKSLKSKKKF